MRRAAFIVHRVFAWAYLAGGIVAFFAAGLAVFTLNAAASTGTAIDDASFDRAFGGHLLLGDALFFVALAVAIAALLARPGRHVILASVTLLVLDIVQATLAFTSATAVRALHPVVGLLLLVTAAYLVAGSPPVPLHRGTSTPGKS